MPLTGHCKMAPIAEINFKYVVKTYPVEQINCQFILILPFSHFILPFDYNPCAEGMAFICYFHKTSAK